MAKKTRIAHERQADVAALVCDFQIVASAVFGDESVSLRRYPVAGFGHGAGDWAVLHLVGDTPEVVVYARAAAAYGKPADAPEQPEACARAVYRAFTAALLTGWELPPPGVYVVDGMLPNGDRTVQAIGTIVPNSGQGAGR